MGCSYFMVGELVLVVLLIGDFTSSVSSDPYFDANYGITWGNNHVVNHKHQAVELYLDQSSGSFSAFSNTPSVP